MYYFCHKVISIHQNFPLGLGETVSFIFRRRVIYAIVARALCLFSIVAQFMEADRFSESTCNASMLLRYL